MVEKKESIIDLANEIVNQNLVEKRIKISDNKISKKRNECRFCGCHRLPPSSFIYNEPYRYGDAALFNLSRPRAYCADPKRAARMNEELKEMSSSELRELWKFQQRQFAD